MKNSLIFVSKLISEGLKVEFDKDGYKVNNVHGIVVVQACREKNLYLLNINVWKESANVVKFSNEITTLLTRSQVTGWDQVEGLTKSSCGIKTW